MKIKQLILRVMCQIFQGELASS